MATGDSDDMDARLRGLLPPWFPDSAPVLAGVLAAIAAAFAQAYSLLQYVIAQTRIATAYGAFLDLIAWDFFGPRFLRRSQESDDGFRPRILAELLRPRQTRDAIATALFNLTGRYPVIYEPWSPGDNGSYGTGRTGYGGFGLGYGSLQYPFQIFVTALRPLGAGIPMVSGYGGGGGGYGVGADGYVDMAQIDGPVTDAEIYACIAGVIAAGITAWTTIEDAPSVPVTTLDESGPTLDMGWITLDAA
jgi:hypothetical protein